MPRIRRLEEEIETVAILCGRFGKRGRVSFLPFLSLLRGMDRGAGGLGFAFSFKLINEVIAEDVLFDLPRVFTGWISLPF